MKSIDLAASEAKPKKRCTELQQRLTLIRRNKVLYLFILPAFLYFLIFIYVPIYGVQIAFKDFVASKGFSGSSWAVPFYKHFKTFFSSVYFWDILRNTLGLSLYYIAASFPAAIILALMINEVKNVRFKKTVQNITYIPYFISTVVLVGMINLFFARSGLVFSAPSRSSFCKRMRCLTIFTSGAASGRPPATAPSFLLPHLPASIRRSMRPQRWTARPVCSGSSM